jgi:hypothetical protein
LLGKESRIHRPCSMLLSWLTKWQTIGNNPPFMAL